MRRTRTLAAPLLAIGFGLICTATAPAQEPTDGAARVKVRLSSGRVLVAAIDQRTDDDTLWLRFDGPTATLFRPVEWQAVASLERDGALHSGPQMRAVATDVQSERKKPSGRQESPLPFAVAKPLPELYAKSRAPAGQVVVPLSRVRSIDVDAYVANWNADTEVDGIVLSVSALDQYGAPVPASGTVQAELRADRRSLLKPPLPRLRQQFHRLGYWSEQFLAAHGGRMVYLLPFQAVHPEFDPAVAAFGLLHVKLTLPGHGVYQASVADLRIRPFSNIRNQIENSTGTRFLPIEQTGRSRHIAPPR